MATAPKLSNPLSGLLGRAGVFPSFLLGMLLLIGGVIALNALINNTWVVPGNHPNFIDFQRGAVEQSVSSQELLRASDWGLIALFLLAAAVAVMGFFLPIIYYANRRIRLMRNVASVGFGILLRQSFFIGLWCAFGLLLQMNRTFNLPVMLLMGVVFVLLELFFLMRRRHSDSFDPGPPTPIRPSDREPSHEA